MFKQQSTCAFIVTPSAVWSACAICHDEGRFFAIAESEDKEPVIVEALSEETAMYRLGAKLKGTIFFIKE